MFRETVRDFMVNQQFRRDYWVKGARKFSALERAEQLRQQSLILTSQDVSLKVTGALGEANMSEPVYTPILDLLCDYKPRTLGQIEQAVKRKELTFAQIAQAAVVLTGAGHMALVQDDAVISKSRKQTEKLNTYLCQKSRGSGDIGFLASPITGGGIPVNRFQQLFLLSVADGKKLPEEWAEAAWRTISAQGQKLVKEGETLQSVEQNLTELSAQALAFKETRLPILKALGI